MELHLLLGVVNHLLQSLSKIWTHAPEWLSLLHIQQQPFHDGKLAGNECRKLLKNVDVLERLAQQHSFFPAVPFIDTLRKFNGVVLVLAILLITAMLKKLSSSESPIYNFRAPPSLPRFMLSFTMFHNSSNTTIALWEFIQSKQLKHSIIFSETIGKGTRDQATTQNMKTDCKDASQTSTAKKWIRNITSFDVFLRKK